MRSRRLPNRAFAFCAAAAMLVASCEVGPDYEPPALEEEVIEESFTAVKDPAFSSDEGDIREWWTVFDDPMLTSIIALAEEGNKDLEIAVSRVSEARARLGFAKAGRYPSIGIGGGVNARNDFFTGFETRTVSSIGADVSWELDLFGRVARQIEAENASYEATEEDQRDVRVTHMAEVARAYIGVRALQMQLQSAERNLASQEQILELTRSRTLNGISSELD
ncbi:MAG: TolC family protein, partial [Planctomycetota bacterium]|nr:TolC family protein [Planctomycetota bacterium]